MYLVQMRGERHIAHLPLRPRPEASTKCSPPKSQAGRRAGMTRWATLSRGENADRVPGARRYRESKSKSSPEPHRPPPKSKRFPHEAISTDCAESSRKGSRERRQE